MDILQIAADNPGRVAGSAWASQWGWSIAQDLGDGVGGLHQDHCICVLLGSFGFLDTKPKEHLEGAWAAAGLSDRAGTTATFVWFPHITLSDNSRVHHK